MPVDWLTRSFNKERTGANLQETILTKSKVNVNEFGRLFVRAVDGQIYAQPLVVTNVTIEGKVEEEVVIVATTQNFVYAFDAKDPARCDPLWRTEMGQLGIPPNNSDYNQVPGYSSVKGGQPISPMHRPYADFTDQLGIVSTPVIDDAKKTLYVVVKSKSQNGQQFFVKLHKLDLATGKDLPGSPVEVKGSVSGSGFASKNGTVDFDTKWHLPRPGLLLANGNIYMAFGSIGDAGPYHGWVFSYDAQTLQRKAVHCTTPDWGQGGIWQSGSGLAFADDGVYYVAGNGPDENLTPQIARTPQEPTDAELAAGPGYGNTIVKLDADTLAVVSWFSPTNTRQLSEVDDDLTSGPVLPPDTNVVLGFGKDGKIYVCDRTNLGKWDKNQNKNLLVQKVTSWHIHGTPVYWRGKQFVYLWSENDRCLQYRMDQTGGTVHVTLVSYSQFTFNMTTPGKGSQFQQKYQMMPGGMLTLSANGEQDGIIWAAHPTDKDANHATVAGTLRAFDADNLQNELWNSNHDPMGSDIVGNFAKFCPPTVANGKVYLATFSGGLAVYGLLPSMPPPAAGMWKQATLGATVLGSAYESCGRYTVLGAGQDIWNTSDAFHFVYKEVAATGRLTITGIVGGIQNTDPWAKAGFMFRDTLDPDSPHAMVVITPSDGMHPNNGVAFQYRPTKGSISMNMNTPGVTASQWLQLIREPVGGQPGKFQFTARHSPDGVNWTPVGTPVVLAMGNSPKVGMAVTSHTTLDMLPGDVPFGNSELNLSRFEQVKIE